MLLDKSYLHMNILRELFILKKEQPFLSTCIYSDHISRILMEIQCFQFECMLRPLTLTRLLHFEAIEFVLHTSTLLQACSKQYRRM